MFESAELKHTVDKDTYNREVPQLRADLLDAQFELNERKEIAVVVLINGMDAAGKGETVNLLNKWMDPRHIETLASDEPSEEESERPFMWRFWRALPPKGKMGVLFNNWYTDALWGQSQKRKKAVLDQQLAEIRRFETMLMREGILLLKLWFHLSKETQKKRLKALEKDPRTRWRVTERDWEDHANYELQKEVASHVLRQTSTGFAPWYIVDGEDERYRSLFVGKIILDALKKRRDPDAEPGLTLAPNSPENNGAALLGSLQLCHEMSKKEYRDQLERYQGKLATLIRDPAFAKRTLVLVFEGTDAAGKGGAIRRVTSALDARNYRIVSVGVPTEEELAQPYLWRFWRQLPRNGKMVVFDRSWYGRVLVERVEGFCSKADWMRAYAEINDFEDQLVNAGAVVAKFWLAIGPDEQLKRFKIREQEPHKRFKITPEDWRNRDKWDAYVEAMGDMIDRTSTEIAPWTIVEAENKYYARIKVLRTICAQLETALKG